MAERTPNPVFEVISDEILQVKIADLGNACWTVSDTAVPQAHFDVRRSL